MHDEGFRRIAVWDNKQFSYGYGCRAPGEGAIIDREAAAELLGDHIDQAIADFARIFKGHTFKFNDVRAEAFTNMIFNMGPGRKDAPSVGGLYSFKNTLNLIFKNNVVPWATVADNLSKSLWFRQVGVRAVRICREVATGDKT